MQIPISLHVVYLAKRTLNSINERLRMKVISKFWQREKLVYSEELS